VSVEIWLLFVATVAVFFATPGPTNLLVVGQALANGAGPAMWAVWGIIAANVAGLGLSFLGLGTLLAASPGVFAVLKWGGVAYLIHLGIRQWRQNGTIGGAAADPGAGSAAALFRRGFAVTMLNPKIIVFYAAFLPQFMRAGGAPLVQMAILAATYVTLSLVGCTLHAVLAGSVRRWLGRSRWILAVNRTAAVMLIGSGLLTATIEQH
jgi:threonine/homoserine/homoserine lactone efflux protein